MLFNHRFFTPTASGLVSFPSQLALRASALALLGLAWGCDLGIEGSGVVESETYAVDQFDSISIEDGFTARLIAAPEFSIVVHADDNIIDHVDVAQRGDDVTVSLSNLNVHDATLEVDILLPELSALRLSDGSRLETEDFPAAGSLKLVVRDGSRLKLSTEKTQLAHLNLSCEDGSHCAVAAHARESLVEVRDGSHATLRGSSHSMTLLLSDGSHLDGSKHEISELNVRAHDGSHAKVLVTDFVQGKVSDGSHLEIAGEPDTDLDVNDGSSFDLK